MKMNIIKHIVIASVPAALLLTSLTATAQNFEPGSYKVVGGIAFNKHVTDNHDGTYTVDLESFVTGKVHTETVKVPADIILVMDLSVSMNETGGNNTDYAEDFPQQWAKVTRNMSASASNRNWAYNSFDAADATDKGWNFLYDGVYYPVFSENITTGPTDGRGRHMFIWIPDSHGDLKKTYIYGTEGQEGGVLHDVPNTTPTSAGGTIYTGTLYSGGWHWNDLDDAPTNSNRNYYYKVGDKYYPVKARRVTVGSVNTYQLIVPLPDGDKYLTGTTGSDPFVSDPYGHYESTYNTLYAGDLYHNGGWTSYSITNGAATSGHYYKHTDGQYYPVTKVRADVDGNSTYQASVTIDGTRYYLNGDTITETPCPVPFADPDCTIFYGPLYNPPGATYLKREGLRRAVTAFIDALEQKSIEDGLDHRLALVIFNSSTQNVDYPDLAASDLETSGSHILKDFLVVNGNAADLQNEFPSPMPAASGGSYYAQGYALSRGLLDRELGAAEGTDINNNRSIQEYEIPTLKGDDHDNYSKRPKIVITVGDFQVASIGTARTEANKLKALDNTTLVSVQVRRGTSATYDGYAKELASSNDFYYKAENFDEELIEKLMSITDDIGGAELEVEGTVTTVDVVSQAFNVPTGADVSAPKVYIAPLTGKKDGTSWEPAPTVLGGDDEFVYYTFGTEVLQGEGSGITLNTDGEDEQGNKKITVEGFDYSAHWCGPESTGYHTDGQKLILRFTVVPNENAVGGPEVQTNTDESGIWIPDPDNPDKKIQIAKFNQPSVSLPVNLWIEKQGLTGDDSAVFTIYYADPSTPANAGKSPHEMTYQSFTKVIVHAKDLVDGMVKITGLDSKFYYKIKEDAWAWSYDDQTGEMYSSDVIQNPFKFVNEKKTETVKHAESFKTNVFSTTNPLP